MSESDLKGSTIPQGLRDIADLAACRSRRASALETLSAAKASLAEISAQVAEVYADAFFPGESLPAALEHIARALRHLARADISGVLRQLLASAEDDVDASDLPEGRPPRVSTLAPINAEDAENLQAIAEAAEDAGMVPEPEDREEPS